MIDVSHLIPSSQDLAKRPNIERLRSIRADMWIGYPRARTVLSRLDELINWPSKQRMPNLLIIGSTNNGKSMIVEKFRRSHSVPPLPQNVPSEHEHIPIVVMQMPSEPSSARFYATLLGSIGAPLNPRSKVAHLEQLALSLLRTVKTGMIVIDELHNVLAGRSDVQREFLNLLRFLGNELRLPIVGTRR